MDRKQYLKDKIGYYKLCIDVAEDLATKGQLNDWENEQMFKYVQTKLSEIKQMEKEVERLEKEEHVCGCKTTGKCNCKDGGKCSCKEFLL